MHDGAITHQSPYDLEKKLHTKRDTCVVIATKLLKI